MKPDVNVLLTGFTPFSNYNVNPSWEAVKLLERNGLGLNLDHIRLHCYELPVVYCAVEKQLPKLWKSIKPDLTVHVGVSRRDSVITLEQYASNGKYESVDNENCLPNYACCVLEGAETLCSGIEMEKVGKYIMSTNPDIEATVSKDAGKFLCDFAYYTSMNIDKERSAFIHIPPLDEPYNLEQLTQAISSAIIGMLIQLKLLDTSMIDEAPN